MSENVDYIAQFANLTADELTERMKALEESGRDYKDCAAEYEALSAARTKTGWKPNWWTRRL